MAQLLRLPGAGTEISSTIYSENLATSVSKPGFYFCALQCRHPAGEIPLNAESPRWPPFLRRIWAPRFRKLPPCRISAVGRLSAQVTSTPLDYRKLQRPQGEASFPLNAFSPKMPYFIFLDLLISGTKLDKLPIGDKIIQVLSTYCRGENKERGLAGVAQS